MNMRTFFLSLVTLLFVPTLALAQGSHAGHDMGDAQGGHDMAGMSGMAHGAMSSPVSAAGRPGHRR